MLHEDLRYIHEDVERLEQAIADRVLEEPRHIRNRLARDHEVANFLVRIQQQSEQALHIYNNKQEARTQEVQLISTGDPFEGFYKQLDDIKTFHKRYPNEPTENLERVYRPDGGPGFAGDINGMFTGEEAFGRFFDLTSLHEDYLNLPGIKDTRKLTYLQYLDIFHVFTPPQCSITRQQKLTDEYFGYVGALAQYLESFMRRTKPLQDLDKLFRDFDAEFEASWQKDEVPGWQKQMTQANGNAPAKPATEGTGQGLWCADCEKEFGNANTYNSHVKGRKHIKNKELREQREQGSQGGAATDHTVGNGTLAKVTNPQRTKEKAIAQREHRVRKLAAAMSTEREDTRVNVERKAGMTDRERQQELAALYAEDDIMTNAPQGGPGDADLDSDGEEKIYNPLKLPLGWDGKPIPFWLYKLHGLGVEFPCEICGNYVYMGRRAFDKHFGEARHVYGLKCLGVTNTSLFSQITGIGEAERLWEKIKRDKLQVVEKAKGVVEMEDSEGNVMPKQVYDDLAKQGLL